MRADIAELRRLTSRPFGLNLFVPGPATDDAAAFERYAGALAGEAERLGVELGEPRYDDDRWEEKLALAREEQVPVVSFTFGCPDADAVAQLQAAGCAVWVTVTTPDEAVAAADARSRRAGGAGRRGGRPPRLRRRRRTGRRRAARASSARARR